MDTALLVARLLLAAVFGAAAIAKLLDSRGVRYALSDFGVPQRFAAFLMVLLPLAELAIATMLVIEPLALWGAYAALILLVIFSTAIVANLLGGRRPACHCFGRLRGELVGWRTVVRNVVLMGLTGFVLWLGRTNASADPILNNAVLVSIVQTAILATLGFVCWSLLSDRIAHSNGSVDPLPQAYSDPEILVGAPAPDFLLRDATTGGVTSLRDLCSLRRPVVLIFLDLSCRSCLELLRDVARWQRDEAGVFTIAAIGSGSEELNRERSTEYGLQRMLVLPSGELKQRYGIVRTPSAITITPSGHIGSELTVGGPRVRTLVEELAADQRRGIAA